MGGRGYIKDFPAEKWYRDAKLRALRAQASTAPLDERMTSPE